MNAGTYAATNRMTADILKLNQIGKDVADTIVPGHKVQRSEFGNTMMREIATNGGNGQVIGTLGTGATLLPPYTVFTQGMPKYTGNPYDFSIVTENGMFAVMIEPGVVRYTRNGTTRLNTKRQLVNPRGKLILDNNSNPITVPTGENLTLSNRGELFMDGTRFANLGVFDGTFTKGNDGWFVANDPVPSDKAELRSGELESSNANIMELTVERMNVFRNFEALEKSITRQDEMTQELHKVLQS